MSNLQENMAIQGNSGCTESIFGSLQKKAKTLLSPLPPLSFCRGKLRWCSPETCTGQTWREAGKYLGGQHHMGPTPSPAGNASTTGWERHEFWRWQRLQHLISPRSPARKWSSRSRAVPGSASCQGEGAPYWPQALISEWGKQKFAMLHFHLAWEWARAWHGCWEPEKPQRCLEAASNQWMSLHFLREP